MFKSVVQGTAFFVGCVILINLANNIIVSLLTLSGNTQKGEFAATIVVDTPASRVSVFILIVSLITYAVLKKRSR